MTGLAEVGFHRLKDDFEKAYARKRAHVESFSERKQKDRFGLVLVFCSASKTKRLKKID